MNKKFKFNKGTVIVFVENGKTINLETNLDRDLMLSKGDEFILRPNRENQKMKVVDHNCCSLWCEEVN